MANEVVNNLPLGIVLNLAKAENKPDIKPFMAAVFENERVCLVLVRTTSHLALAGDENQGAITTAVNYLNQKGIPVSSIIGAREVADSFADQWCQLLNCHAEVEMAQRIYRLDTVNSVQEAPGFLRMAEVNDSALVTEWIKQFTQEALSPIEDEQARQLAQASIDSNALYIWQDGEAVSMAKKTRPTPNGITVNLVYTPPQHRKRGYASSCVAALSQELLDSGYKFCSLYTDLANPTSNKIYMDIGYNPIADSVVYRFV